MGLTEKSFLERMEMMDFYPVQKKHTHADRIRAMTDEELAVWLRTNTNYVPNGGWLEWLIQEAEA